MPARFHLLPLLLVLPGALPARGQTVSMAHDDPLRANTWELLAVDVPAVPGGGTVALRDMRGGLTVSRPLPEGATRLLMALPAVSPADLPADPPRWPLHLAITRADNSVSNMRLDVPLPGPAAAASSLRLGLPNDLEALPAPVAALGGARPTLVHFSDDDLLSAPPLLFTAVDAIYLPHRLTQNFPEERAAALAGAGVRLLATEDDEAGLAALRRLAWVHVTRADGSPSPDLWAFPAIPAARVTPVQPALAAIPGLLAPVPPDARTRIVLALVPAEALIFLLLAASVFRRNAWLLAATGLLMIGLGAGNVALLRADAPAALRQARWTAGAASLRSEELLSARATLFPQPLADQAPDSELLAPVWPTPAACFAPSALHLDLDQPTDAGPVSRLHADLASREGFVSLRRASLIDAAFHARSAADVARLDPTTSDGAWWIIAGHLLPAAADPPTGPSAPVLAAPTFTDWLPEHPAFAANARAWYELRFDARDRYLLLAPPGQPPHFVTLAP